jgi:hypothetical protein
MEVGPCFPVYRPEFGLDRRSATCRISEPPRPTVFQAYIAATRGESDEDLEKTPRFFQEFIERSRPNH